MGSSGNHSADFDVRALLERWAAPVFITFLLGLALVRIWSGASGLLDAILVGPLCHLAARLGFPPGHSLHQALRIASPPLVVLAYFGWYDWREQRASRRTKVESARRIAHAGLASTPPRNVLAIPLANEPSPPEAAPLEHMGNAPEIGCMQFVPSPPSTKAVPRPAPPRAPESPPPGLSWNDWQTTRDPGRLLMHAIPRIPSRHTCLVLSQLAEAMWPEWHRLFPKDWRPAWCLGRVRAWVFKEASLAELEAAREQAAMAEQRARAASPWAGSPEAAFAAVKALRCAASYAGTEDAAGVGTRPALELVEWAAKAVCALDPVVWAARQAPEPRSERVTRAEREVRWRARAHLANEIRAWIPYPWRKATQWRRMGQWVRAGDASLWLDGWRIQAARPLCPDTPIPDPASG